MEMPWTTSPQLQSKQLQKYRLRRVALYSRRIFNSMQINHAMPRNADAAMDDGRSASSDALGSFSVVIMASVREVLVERVLLSVAS